MSVKRAEHYGTMRERQARIGREMDSAVAAAQSERREEAAAVARRRAERDSEARARLHELGQRVNEARVKAGAAQTDFEIACGQFAAARATMEQVRAVQGVRDAARAELEVFELAMADGRSDPVMRGRR